jgi:ABC-type lipoprotein export system ATPase subunit
MIAVTGVRRTLGGREVVAGVDLAIAEGETVALMGPSGCGKTTLLQMIGLLDRPDTGKIMHGDVDAWKVSDGKRAELRLRSIGFVFQQSNLIEHLSARDNVALPMWRAGASRGAALAEADRLLERFGLTPRANARGNQLSIGEAQRAAIARALINKPRLILADEPTGSLDGAAAAAVVEALFGVPAPTGVLVATHDPEVAARAGRIVRMRDGKLQAG